MQGPNSPHSGGGPIQEDLPLSTRVHELAKELGLKSQDLLDRIQKWGLDVKVSALASLDPAMSDRIRQLVNSENGPEASKAPAAARVEPSLRPPFPSSGDVADQRFIIDGFPACTRRPSARYREHLDSRANRRARPEHGRPEAAPCLPCPGVERSGAGPGPLAPPAEVRQASSTPPPAGPVAQAPAAGDHTPDLPAPSGCRGRESSLGRGSALRPHPASRDHRSGAARFDDRGSSAQPQHAAAVEAE